MTRWAPRAIALTGAFAVLAAVAAVIAPDRAGAMEISFQNQRLIGAPKNPLLPGSRVYVRVRGVRADFEARVGSREVTHRFSGSGRRRTAVLVRRRHFDRGWNRIVVGSGAGASRTFAARHFVSGRRGNGDLRMRRIRSGRGNRAALRLRLASRGQRRFRSLEVKVNGKRVRTRDWVVGDRTPATRWPRGRRAFEALLGADNGITYGRNRVVVTAWRGDGSFDRVRRRVRIARTAPLASAGAGETTSVGRRIRLDGRRTRARRPGEGVRYRWRIASAPEGSTARLRRAQKPRPVLVADRPGRYRIRLVARPRRPASRALGASVAASAGVRAAVDQTTVLARPPTPPLGLPVDTLTDDGGIEVNGTRHTIPAGSTWAQLLVLDRATLEVVANEGFGFSSEITDDAIEDFFGYTTSLDDSKLVILSGGGREVGGWEDAFADPEVAADMGQAFDDLGAGTQWESAASRNQDSGFPDVLSSGQWSLVGVPESSAHANLLAPPSGAAADGGALTGYLQRDVHGNYGFASPQSAAIDTSAPGAPERANAVQVGSQTYTSDQLAEGNSGFHVVVLDGDLALAKNETYTTNDCCSSLPPGPADMAEALIDLTSPAGGSPGYLVVVQSIGTPFGIDQSWVNDQALAEHAFGERPNATVPRNASTWYSDDTGVSLAGAIGALGGPAAHDQIAQMIAPPPQQPQPDPVSREGFTLVAATGQLVESGQLLGNTDPLVPADSNSAPVSRSQALSYDPHSRLIGTLVRDRQWLWKARNGGSAEGFDAGAVIDVAYGPTTEWPFSSTAAERAANRYFAGQLGFDTGDVRVAYYEDSGSDWDAIDDQLAQVGYPGSGHGFERTTFRDVKQQLQREIPMVAEVQAMISDWQRVFTTTTIEGYIDLQSIAGELLAAIERLDAQAEAQAETDQIVVDVLWIASAVGAEVPGVAEALGAAAGAVALASAGSRGPDGAPSIVPVTAEAAKLGQQVAARYQQLESTLGMTSQILVSDWGKLQEASARSKSEWAQNAQVRSAIVDTLTRSAKREFLAALLATTYGVYTVDPGFVTFEATRPWDVECALGAQPFDGGEHVPAAWQTRPVSFQTDGGAEDTVLTWFGLYTRLPDVPVSSADSAPEDLIGPAFESPTSSPDALGADKLAFFADPRFDRRWFWCASTSPPPPEAGSTGRK